jgi:hydroxymethylglutaryl-CoA lyase
MHERHEQWLLLMLPWNHGPEVYMTHPNPRFQARDHFSRHLAQQRGEGPAVAVEPTVRIYEVSPRDGLQNESIVVPAEDKVELIRRLVSAGVRDIEVTSFVKPSWIPQLADARDVIASLQTISTDESVRFWALIPNRRGLERSIDSGVRHIATFMSASETHNKKNLNRTRRESLAGLAEVIGTAKDSGQGVRAYLSTVFGCPYEGEVAVESTVQIALELMAHGADELALGDTTGMGHPGQVMAVIRSLTEAGIPIERIALHMHDTRGTALANVLAGFQAGVRTFDGSVAGVGGCPYAPGASGNAASDDLVHLFEAMGETTGIEIDTLARAGVFLSERLGRELPGRYHRFHLGSNPSSARSQSA